LVRYTTNATLDPSFGGGDGIAAVDGNILDIAIQADGKIVALRNQAFVTRYNPDGSLDTDFGEGGSVSWPSLVSDYYWMNVVAIEADGTILAGGGLQSCYGGNTGCDSYFLLFRFMADGTPVRTFGGSWRIMQEVQDIALQTNGRIIAGGPVANGRSSLVRFRIDGASDTRFAADGVRYIRFNRNPSTLAGVALDRDGKIIVFGTAEGVVYSKFGLARYSAA
jgi:uncharacterized delta-60 repeat protein